MRTILSTTGIFLLAAAVCSAVQQFPTDGDHQAGVFVMGASPQVETIVAKMKRAVADDPQWLQQYLKEKNPAPGEMLPYHPKFGVTQEEYDLFVASLGKLILRHVGDARVHVERTETTIRISVEGVAWPVKDFEFSSNGTTMKCALGSSTETKQINQTDAASPTGRWSGTQWSLKKGDPSISGQSEFISVMLSIGYDEKGGALIYARIIGRTTEGQFNIGDVLRFKE